MTNAEAIAELRNMHKFNYTLAPDEVFQMAISALDKQVGKKPIGIKVEEKDPYTEVAKIVDDWCRKNYYGSAFVTLSLDGRVTTEYLSFNGNNMEFEWDTDWREGERDVVLIGFRMRDNVAFYGYPNSEDIGVKEID